MAYQQMNLPQINSTKQDSRKAYDLNSAGQPNKVDAIAFPQTRNAHKSSMQGLRSISYDMNNNSSPKVVTFAQSPSDRGPSNFRNRGYYANPSTLLKRGPNKPIS